MPFTALSAAASSSSTSTSSGVGAICEEDGPDCFASSSRIFFFPLSLIFIVVKDRFLFFLSNTSNRYLSDVIGAWQPGPRLGGVEVDLVGLSRTKGGALGPPPQGREPRAAPREPHVRPCR